MQIHQNQLKATTCDYLVQCVTKMLLIATHFFVSLSLYL